MFDIDAEVGGLDRRGCAAALDASVLELRRVGARRLGLAAHWADLHAPESEPGQAGENGPGSRSRPGGSQGTPEVSEFAVAELGVLLQTTTVSARNLLRDALDLRHRHPRIWEAVLAGAVEDWQARKVAHATAAASLSLEQARWVDAESVAALTGLPFGRAMAVVEAKIIAVDPGEAEARRQVEARYRYVATGRPSNPAGLRTLIAQTTAGDVARLEAMISHLAALMAGAGDTDDAQVRRAKALGLLANPALACVWLAGAHQAPTHSEQPAAEEPSAVELAAWLGHQIMTLGPQLIDRLRPRTVLYLHCAEETLAGVDRTQVARAEGIGPITIEQLREWVGTDHLTIRPVLDPTGLTPVDSYEVPDRHREALTLTRPYDIFPWGTLGSRRADLDHTREYRPRDEGGPPAQTALDNLGPLSRGHHRAKTFGDWTLHQPLPGLYLWRTPTSHWYRVDHTGSTALGTDTPAIIEQQHQPRSRIESAFLDHVTVDLAA